MSPTTATNVFFCNQFLFLQPMSFFGNQCLFWQPMFFLGNQYFFLATNVFLLQPMSFFDNQCLFWQLMSFYGNSCLFFATNVFFGNQCLFLATNVFFWQPMSFFWQPMSLFGNPPMLSFDRLMQCTCSIERFCMKIILICWQIVPGPRKRITEEWQLSIFNPISLFCIDAKVFVCC